MKRVLWFALGAAVGVLAYPRISQKIVELGQGETLMKAQDWVSEQVDALADLLGGDRLVRDAQGVHVTELEGPVEARGADVGGARVHSLRLPGFVVTTEIVFAGAGDTLSATLAALIASGSDLAGAVEEALGYLDRCLDAGFQPGMGLAIPDRLFWAQPEDTDSDDEAPAGADDDSTALGAFNLPAHDTKH